MKRLQEDLLPVDEALALRILLPRSEKIVPLVGAMDEEEFELLYGLTDTVDEDHIDNRIPLSASKENQEHRVMVERTHNKMQSVGSVKVLYECQCSGKKIRHHPSYEPGREREVMLLCRKCHAAEHARLRRLTPDRPAVRATAAI